MSRILALASGRESVGRTTMTITLAHAIAISGEAALIIDLDPQGAATASVNVARSQSGLLWRILEGAEPPGKLGLLVRSVDAGLDIVPADATPAPAPAPDALDRLGAALHAVAKQYPWILIDCPRGWEGLTRTAMTLADLVIVPLLGDGTALQAARQATAALQQAKPVPEGLPVVLFVIALARDENPHAKAVLSELRTSYASSLLRTMIPLDDAMPQAALQGKTVLQTAPEGLAARAYLKLAKEVMSHVG